MKEKNVLLLLLLFILFSCSRNSFDYNTAFANGDYQAILNQARIDLSSSLDDEAVYFRAKAYYELGDYHNARSSTLFYLLISSSGEYTSDCFQILLHTGTEDERIEAGRYLFEHGKLSYPDMVEYFSILNSEGRRDEATEFYLSIKSSLSMREELNLLLDGRGESAHILQAFENIYKDEGLSRTFTSNMIRAIGIFSDRNESMLLMPLVNLGTGGDSEYALASGDFYRSVNELDKAYESYLEAYDRYPQLTRPRLIRLNRLDQIRYPLPQS